MECSRFGVVCLCYFLANSVAALHAQEPAVNSLAIHSLKLDGTDLKIHVADPKLSFGSVAVSPDGKLLAFDSWPASRFDQSKQFIHVCDLKGEQMRKVTLGAMPKWSPDGELIAFHEYLKLKGSLIIEPSGKGRELVAEKKGSPTWLNGGKSVAMVDWGLTNVTIQDMVSGKRSALRKYAFHQINHGFCISPDGKTICFTRGRFPNCRLCVASIEGAARPQVVSKGAICGGLNFHPDGKRIVFSQGSDSKQAGGTLKPAQLFVLDITRNDDEPAKRVDGTDRDELCLNPCFSPDGIRIFFSSTMR